jgi:hypothetical protein
MVRQPGQIARSGHRRPAKLARVVDAARHHAAHQRDEQQQIDRGEPRAGEDFEETQPIEHRRQGRVLRLIGPHSLGIERVLRQQSARQRAQCQQEQQGQGSAHACQPAPGIAGQCRQLGQAVHQIGVSKPRTGS